ncbi:hypothetical protein AZSI13_17590 [Azospira sp. I13]|uniref:uroporphyrinogen-III C-methyltransferase n=1 Tax=Azospira sp. I13 TaxID=1765050 RepID=UPI000D4F2961|nr:uroporphyrinogen-III C-methyltransferase [Azospira sp. I13]GBG02432.1 hypothetical protein AZSI13_17590 [Azospira sp. I13]
MNDSLPPHESPAQPPVPPAAAAPAMAAAAPPPATARNEAWRNPWIGVAVIALGLAGWQWVETRIKLADTQQELAKRLADADSLSKETRGVARQSQEEVGKLQAKLGALEAKLAESQSQQAALESLYQDLARNRDEWALSEIEQNVTLAAQQLQLAGNVQGAILALQAADSRLARSDRPQFAALRKTLNRDLERLRAAPYVDVSGMSLRLENLMMAADTLPLAFDERPRPEKEVPAEDETVTTLGFWQRLGLDLWGEVKSLVRIQRFDRPEPALLSPSQSFFLRENLKLRLLNARLALLSRDQWTFRSELKLSQAWMERYFNTNDKSVQTAVGSIKQLAGTEIVIELPLLNDSLNALKTLKLGKERK